MSEILADIEETAYDEADQFSDVYGCDSEIRARLCRAFEQAIAAERERCAQVAVQRFIKDNVIKIVNGQPYITGSAAIYAAERIAAAIRKGDA